MSTPRELVLSALRGVASPAEASASSSSRGPPPTLGDEFKRDKSEKEALSAQAKPLFKGASAEKGKTDTDETAPSWDTANIVAKIEGHYGTEVCRDNRCVSVLLDVIESEMTGRYDELEITTNRLHAAYTLLLPCLWRDYSSLSKRDIDRMIRQIFSREYDVSHNYLIFLFVLADAIEIAIRISTKILASKIVRFSICDESVPMTVLACMGVQKPKVFGRLAVFTLSVVLRRLGEPNHMIVEYLTQGLEARESFHIIRKIFRDHYNGESRSCCCRKRVTYLACLVHLLIAPSRRDENLLLREIETIPPRRRKFKGECTYFTHSRELYQAIFDIHVNTPPGVEGHAMASRQRVCWWCKEVGNKREPMMNCLGCGVANYCSLRCQAKDWKHGGHKTHCRMVWGGEK